MPELPFLFPLRIAITTDSALRRLCAWFSGYVDYLYDDVGELYSARTYDSLGSEILAQRFGYQYDAAWNLNNRTNNATVSSFNVNTQNQLTSSPEGNHGSDGNGNMTTSGQWGYQYDDENQMTEALYMSADWMTGSKTDYTYDGKMRLRKADDYSWTWISGTNGTWTLSATKYYLYDGMLAVQERNSANTPTVTYTRGNDLSGTLQGAGGIGGLLARSQGYSSGHWSTHQFYHADGNGNITYLVNSSQTLAASCKYDPFGGTISSSGTSATANTYRFSSKEYSTVNGMYYYGYRWYHPNLQRWLNRDPLSDVAGLMRLLSLSLTESLKPVEYSLGVKLYCFNYNASTYYIDYYGLYCGSDSYPWYKPGNEWTVPDHPFGFDFTEACKAHDECYGSCGVSNQDCDLRLKTIAKSQCKSSKNLSNPALCNFLAHVYYSAISNHGQSSFNAAQKKACKCNGGATGNW